MTIGMLVESLTSKVGALNGHFVDATPFQKCENPNDFVSPIEEFGARLERAGFAKHGGKGDHSTMLVVVGVRNCLPGVKETMLRPKATCQMPPLCQM